MLGDRLYDLFEGPEGDVNPVLVRKVRENEGPRLRERGQRPPRPPVPRRPDVLLRLDREGLLPAITFIFSRAGCAAAVEQCLRAGLKLNTDEERVRVRQHVQQRTRDLPRDDLRVLGYWEWLEGLERGLAAHHAGMLPTFKEVVEELFVEGLVKAVFATETLALGINMPARSVVLEKLVKWNGDAHVEVTPGEYTQLTGRAGRRGIDIEGHAVVLWQPGLDPRQVAGLASTRTYPLRSSFRPSYNMAVNLVGSVGREPARALLESSFAQFQADRSVVGLARQVSRNLEALEGYREGMTCPLGDVAEYDAIRQAVRKRESELASQGSAQRRAQASSSLEQLKVGDVIAVPQGRRSGLAVVIDPGLGQPGQAHPLVVTIDRWAGRLSDADFSAPVEPLGRLRVPKSFNHRSPQARKDMASSLRALGLQPSRPGRARAAAADDEQLGRLRAQLRQHPVHGCDDREQHLRWAERWSRLRHDTDKLERRVEGKTHSIARVFDQVCLVLEELGYLDGDEVSAAGRQLARVYNESDLLVVECLRQGLWDGLSAAELASVVSTVVFENRRPEDGTPAVPGGAVKAALDGMARLWGDLRDVEARQGLGFLREPDAGFAWASWRWAAGAELEQILQDDPDLTPGDFVRWCKQLVDVLGHVATIADEPVRSTARASLSAVRRGVVTYSSVS
jgi:ATP-dependent RNA helicase HelY